MNKSGKPLFGLILGFFLLLLFLGANAKYNFTFDAGATYLCAGGDGGGGGGGGSNPPGCTNYPPSELCTDYKLGPYHWEETAPGVANVAYYIDYNELPKDIQGNTISKERIKAAAEAAFNEWEAFTHGIRFYFYGYCNGCARNHSDVMNGIGFKQFPWNPDPNLSTPLGETYGYRVPFTSYLLEVDTLLDLNMADSDESIEWHHWWTDNFSQPCMYEYDIQNVLTHEFGHWLQLSDLYKQYDKLLTMYGDLSADICKTTRRTLGEGDKSGIQAIYGA